MYLKYGFFFNYMKLLLKLQHIKLFLLNFERDETAFIQLFFIIEEKINKHSQCFVRAQSTALPIIRARF